MTVAVHVRRRCAGTMEQPGLTVFRHGVGVVTQGRELQVIQALVGSGVAEVSHHALAGIQRSKQKLLKPTLGGMIASGNDEVQSGVDQVTSRAFDPGGRTGDAAEHVGNAEGGVNEVGARRRGKSANGEAG